MQLKTNAGIKKNEMAIAMYFVLYATASNAAAPPTARNKATPPQYKIFAVMATRNAPI